MVEAAITVAGGTPFNIDSINSVLSIAVTNTPAISCKSGTDAYYYVELSDGTNEQKRTFAVMNPGTIEQSHVETFVVENTTLDAITSSSGVIYYTAA